MARASRRASTPSIACYHDQGLIPVKLLGFGRAVNVTLGLPIVRTSVDHGTAYDIAGRGAADHSSLVEAILLAARLAARQPGRPEGSCHRTGTRLLASSSSAIAFQHRCAKRRRSGEKLIADNRKAFHDFHILETFEAGVVLVGTEVKAIREGRVNLRDSFGRVEGGEVWVYNVHISPVHAPRLREPRADAAAQAAPATRRNPQADRQDRREGHDARADADVLQERPHQDRHRPREGQEGRTTSARRSGGAKPSARPARR